MDDQRQTTSICQAHRAALGDESRRSPLTGLKFAEDSSRKELVELELVQHPERQKLTQIGRQRVQGMKAKVRRHLCKWEIRPGLFTLETRLIKTGYNRSL